MEECVLPRWQQAACICSCTDAASSTGQDRIVYEAMRCDAMQCEREGEGRQLGFEGGRDNHRHPVATAEREEKRREEMETLRGREQRGERERGRESCNRISTFSFSRTTHFARSKGLPFRRLSTQTPPERRRQAFVM